MMNQDLITPDSARTLDGLFHERARRSPDGMAYRYYDEASANWHDLTWSQMLEQIARWQVALSHENLAPGDRIAIMLKNCPQWVMFDQAALGLGLVTVPLYPSDRPENVAYILQDCSARLLLVESGQHWQPLADACRHIDTLQRIVTLRSNSGQDSRLRSLDAWLPNSGDEFRHETTNPHALATIVYTSGTTGKPKGVMLSHHNLLSNAWHSLQPFDVYADDLFLSFLPLSHALERMAGYYLPVMAGAKVAYARSIQQLQEDLANLRPSILIAVPRIFERIQAGLHKKLIQAGTLSKLLFRLTIFLGNRRFLYRQQQASWHPTLILWPILQRLVASKVTARLGGRLRLILCGGAAVSPAISRTFIGLGLQLLQGYGLTETSPVISVNRVGNNVPASVGQVLAEVETRVSDQGELQVRGPNVMLGYWNNPEASRNILTDDGWLKTGDVVNIDQDGHISITGRLKEILVLSNGEKVPPADIELAILNDPLFEQVMLIGEGRPYLSLLAVVNEEQWLALSSSHQLQAPWPEVLLRPEAQSFALKRIAVQLRPFPGYARIRRVALLHEPWSTENDLLTPTLKVKRQQVLERYRGVCEKLYAGFE